MILFHLLIPILLAALLDVPVEGANAGLERNPASPASTIYFNLLEQAKAQEAAGYVESVFALPEGHLSPVYGFDEFMHGPVVAHLSSPNTRFVVLNKRSKYGPVAFAPWMIQRSAEEPWLRSVLFLQVIPTGTIVPMGYAVVQDGIPPLHKKDFWETIQRAATMLQPDFKRRFAISYIMTPVF